ncbi:MAG: hypothetical protein ACO3I6_05660 [Ilumatobacteraceae bacterium]
MISKKAKMVGATVVLAAAGFGITTVASAHRVTPASDSRVVRMAPMHDRRNGERLDAVSGLLGITSDELKTELRSGKSLAEIATEKGVDTQKVIDAIVAEMTEKVNEKVAEGKITQDQADTMLANAVERVTAMVNGEHPARAFGHENGERHRPFGGRGHRGGFGRGWGAPTTDQNEDA